MQRVQTTVAWGNYSSNEISDRMFGTNMLFHTDRTSTDSDFRKVIEKLGTNVIRFPGGTVTEHYFDITNPDATQQSNILDVMTGRETVRTREVTTLSEYLDYQAEIGGAAVIVVPTYRYFDLETREIRPEAEAEFRTFLRQVMSGEYGPVDELTIELGNEYYQHNFDWTTAEFAALQADIAGWLDDEAEALGRRDDLGILVQAGRNLEDNQTLASEYAGEGAPTIDGVITHLYGTNASGDPLGIGGGVKRRLDEIDTAFSEVLGPDYDLAVTEWNVGESGEDTTIVNGVMRSAPLLRMYAEMLDGGVDMAMIWAAQTNGPAGLSESEGNGSDLSPTGYLYSMISESTEGLRLVDPDGNFKLMTDGGNTLGYTYTFEGENRSVTYFASGIGEAFSLSANLDSYLRDGAYVYARVLDVAPGQDVTGYWSDASLKFQTDIRLGGSGGTDIFDITVEPYQLIELNVVYDQGVSIAGDSQNALRDELIGSDHNDSLSGNGGWDELFGQGGSDVLDGGDGNDIINGGSGEDLLIGGGGNDRLYGATSNDILNGGYGNDRLKGNSGDDVLNGENGIDVLYGGSGNDTLSGGKHNDFLVGGGGNDRLDGGTHNDKMWGGGGADTFVFATSYSGYDTVVDFAKGTDKIDLSGLEFASFDQVSALIEQRDYGARIDFGNGNVLMLKGMVVEDLDASDFIL